MQRVTRVSQRKPPLKKIYMINCLRQGGWIRTNVMRFSLSSGELKSSRLLHLATLPHLENSGIVSSPLNRLLLCAAILLLRYSSCTLERGRIIRYSVRSYYFYCTYWLYFPPKLPIQLTHNYFLYLIIRLI